MQVSKKRINQNLENQIYQSFYQVVADLKTPEEVKLFFADLLGKAELTVLAKRLAIAYYLQNKRSYQNIKENLKVSSATIATIDKMRHSKGIQLALKKIEADRWADQWANKIEDLFKIK